MPAVDTIGARLRGIPGDETAELAGHFDHVPTPPAFAWAFPGPRRTFTGVQREVDLGGAADRVAIIAGPHALWSRAELHAVAAHLGAPVANTWGAKGIFPWDSPHHMGTCGLQADDFALLGLARYDLVLGVGIDPLEAPPAALAPLDARHVGVNELEVLLTLPARTHPIEPNALYDRIAAVAQPGYVDDRSPRHPARAVMDLKQSMPPGAVLMAQPGPVGLWVARTFPTDGPGTVFVPAVAVPGIAAALAWLAARAGRDAVAVAAAPVDPVTTAIGRAAAAGGTPFRLEVWADDVDLALTSLLVDAAGPVVAWTE
jgi:thiamine pyrophosphate-dependent acetolactate synthase large subunit-like protein